jgi:alpha-beta hydrolase superfamily lysophospholipase
VEPGDAVVATVQSLWGKGRALPPAVLGTLAGLIDLPAQRITGPNRGSGYRGQPATPGGPRRTAGLIVALDVHHDVAMSLPQHPLTVPVTEFRVPGSDGWDLFAYRGEPEAPPRGVVHIVAGVGDHVRRGGFQRLAGALLDAGFAVSAHDHRSEGGSAKSLEQQGHTGPDGWNRIVADIGVLIAAAHDRHPGVPVVLFAHSLGSFASQQWILDHSADIAGLALSGTAAVDVLAANLDPDSPPSLEAFNAPWAPGRTGFEWLSRDEHEVDLYVADPQCGFTLDDEAMGAMLRGGSVAADPQRLANVRTDLPIHIAVGDQDPVNAGLALITALKTRYTDAGLTDVTVTAWPGARHEILNETNREEVLADILAFVERVTAAPATPR